MPFSVRIALGAASLAAGLVAAGSAGAVMTETYNADTDASADDFSVDGYSLLDFQAEGRIGGPGTFEIDVGRDTAGAFDTDDHDWPKGDPESFTLDYDGSSAVWNVGGDEVDYPIKSPSGFNSLLIRTATPYSGTEVAFSNMELDGKEIGDYSNNHDSDASDSDRLVKWLGVHNDLDLGSGFELTGDVAMDWPQESKPSQSNLAFQIKGANRAQEVPVPATAALLAGGLLAWGVGRRRS